MPTSTYIPLATITLGSTDSEIVFSSIPATYRDLVMVFQGGITTGSLNFTVAINGDETNGNYAFVQMSGTGSSTVSTSGNIRFLNYYGYPQADLNAVIIAQFMDYSSTDKHKTYLSRANNAGNGVTAVAGRWANTAAITSLTFKLDTTAAPFQVGSTFSLFGIAS